MIIEQGGHWGEHIQVGVTMRSMTRAPSSMIIDVASSNMKNTLNYTDHHDVDEDLTVDVLQGGSWTEVYDTAGVMHRGMDQSSDYTAVGVASLKNKD